jgi:outer membrane protein insertion porin family
MTTPHARPWSSTLRRGDKVKIKKIHFEGREQLKEKKLFTASEKTAKKEVIHRLKKSKFIEKTMKMICHY